MQEKMYFHKSPRSTERRGPEKATFDLKTCYGELDPNFFTRGATPTSLAH